MNRKDFYNYEIDFKTNNFNSFPHDIVSENELKLVNEILERKKSLNGDVVILSHHYQSKWIADIGDFVGDSFELSAKISKIDAKKIIFAGVHFMAESADILSREDQTIYLPNTLAGCPMADMATIGELENVWSQLTEVLPNKKIVPITYMNSTAEIKSFCGEHNGAVCTSSNAESVLKWAYSVGDVVLFLPDKNLGRNTATKMGIPQSEQIIYDFNEALGGHSESDIQKAKIILWNGFCHVHTYFAPDMVKSLKESGKKVTLLVHPESNPDVIALADGVGSTKYITEYIEKSELDETIVVGTEINLVYRMAQKFPNKKIVPLRKSLCPNMYRINIPLIHKAIMEFPVDMEIHVPENIKENAKKALERMLEIAK
ncbi:quinolinate synthase NadA [bacterium]|nr:quinolinate synthase NadA [bacterium]